MTNNPPERVFRAESIRTVGRRARGELPFAHASQSWWRPLGMSQRTRRALSRPSVENEYEFLRRAARTCRRSQCACTRKTVIQRQLSLQHDLLGVVWSLTSTVSCSEVAFLPSLRCIHTIPSVLIGGSLF